jgi:hypothetical protein
MRMLPKGAQADLGPLSTTVVVTATGEEYTFTGVKSVFREEDGTLWLEKLDGSFSCINKTYQYCEFTKPE